MPRILRGTKVKKSGSTWMDCKVLQSDGGVVGTEVSMLHGSIEQEQVPSSVVVDVVVVLLSALFNLVSVGHGRFALSVVQQRRLAGALKMVLSVRWGLIYSSGGLFSTMYFKF